MSLRIDGFNTAHIDIGALDVMLLNSGFNPKIPREKLLPSTYEKRKLLPNGVTMEGCTNPVPMWYIEGTKSKILVETGLDEETVKECNQALAKYRCPHFMTKRPEHDINQFLAKFDLTPQDIDLVILTHLHLDHFANCEAFTKATFLVQKEEIPLALTPPSYAAFDFYYPEFAHHLTNVLDRIEILEGDRKIEPGVEVWKIGGHTPGLMVVAVETKDGLAVLASDQCLTYKNWEYRWPMGCFFNLKEVIDGFRRLEEDADIVIPQHDYSFWERYPNGVVG